MKTMPPFACLVLIVSASFAAEASFPKAKGAVPRAGVPEGVQAHRDLAYVENGHARQKLDLFVPERHDAPLPLIIWVHGGAWAAGSKDGCPPLGQGFTGRGYAVASIGYRLSGDAIFPAQIQDCKAAIRWLRAHAPQYHLDPDRFAVWGSSAGGHLVALLGTSGGVPEFDVGAHLDVSSRVQAVCDYYGPTDLLQMDAHAIPDARLKHDPPGSPESRLIGGPIQENREKAARANPITYVSPDDPPFLIVHGDQDPLVPWHQSQLLFDALKPAGVSVRFHTIHGAGHGGPGFGGSQIDEMVNAFFERHLKAPPAAGTAPEATVSESTAGATDAARPTPARPGGGRRGIPWEVVLRADTNKDGKISRNEFRGPPPLFDRLDRDRDGLLTKEEHDAAFPPLPDGDPPLSPSPSAAPSPSARSAEPPTGILLKPLSYVSNTWAAWSFSLIASPFGHARSQRPQAVQAGTC